MTLTANTSVLAAPEPPRGAGARRHRFALAGLLAATAVLYLWGLGSAGWANDFYAAAAQAGTQSWKAWLFASLDSGNAITVDKPPVSIWFMALSGRLFGFTPFTMLLPQALMGVASVGVLYAAVRRVSGPGAGLIAGAALAVMPVAASMFRYNNPDALLVLLLVVAGYLTVRAIETGRTRWMVGAGVILGVAFLTKMLQAFLVVPGLALAFLVAAPIAFWPRVRALVAGGVAMVATAGPFLALVSLWPADSRPYIGGSTDNSLLQLALGYNGLQRIAGRGEGPGGGGPGMGDGPGGGPGGGAHVFFGGTPGIGRMFGPSFGAEVSWLLPAALIGLVALLWTTRRAQRTSPLRASLLLWGGWLLVAAAVFSFMDGIIHPYYTLALAPAVAALVGISAAELWRDRHSVAARATLAVMSAGTGVWAFVLLGRAHGWQPWLRWVVLIGSLVVAALLVAGVQRWGRLAAAVAGAALILGAAAPAAYAIETAAHPAQGPGAMAGPAAAHADFGGPGPGGPGGPGGSGGPGGFGGPGRASDNVALQNLVKATDNRWAAATVGSMTASSLELSTGTSVMAIGGFMGSDPSPTLEQFQQYVDDGQVRYFIADGHRGPGRDSGSAAEITSWVAKNFASEDVGGATVYDLAR
ncbi:glycosyltransferase family 39 protein [Mycolicibacterium sp. 3033]|nr:glycosyltransferase family 39 protein [Mycolicibacterium aurantiacum]